MLAKNIDVGKGLVNGARGVVVKFNTSQRGTETNTHTHNENLDLQLRISGGEVCLRSGDDCHTREVPGKDWRWRDSDSQTTTTQTSMGNISSQESGVYTSSLMRESVTHPHTNAGYDTGLC